MKTFYLARMEEARLTGDRYAIPKDFDARRYFRNTFGLFVGGARNRFDSACVSPRRSPTRSASSAGIPQQKIEDLPDGEAILELPAVSIREAREFVLRYGKNARVLAPPELVADLRRTRPTRSSAATRPKRSRTKRLRRRDARRPRP